MKRADLQGLRGVAVLLVLLFHLQPHLFPLGFVGVDMFFVVSGYLMSQILAREVISFAVVKEFYVRRFKRIVPVFFVFCIFVYVGCYMVVFNFDRAEIVTDLKWALTFTSNIQPFYESHGYWDLISTYRFFVHSWSLGVELQFYLIAPLVLGTTNRWDKGKRCALLILLAVSSFLFQLFSTPTVSYGFMYCRIWQFLLGSLAFECGRKEVKKIIISKFHLCDAFLLILIALVTLNPQCIGQTAMRFIGTTTTACVIYLCDKDASRLLTNSLLVFVGDVSYSLYLVHWPLIVGTKYYLNENSLHWETVVGLFFGAIILATLFYLLVEQVLIACRTTTSVTVVTASVLFLCFSSTHYSMDFLSVGKEKTHLARAIAWNIREHEQAIFPLHCHGGTEVNDWTNHTDNMKWGCQKGGDGPKILVIGNSIAFRAFPLLIDIFKNRYSQLRLFSEPGCVPIYNNCPVFNEAARRVVGEMKPDILFIIYLTRSREILGPVRDFTNDTVLNTMQKSVEYYSEGSRHVVIDMPYYYSPTDRLIAKEIGKRLQQGRKLDDMKVTRQQDSAQQRFHRARLQHLKCSNCVLNRVNEALFEGDFMYFYNRSSLRSYTREGIHLTKEGLQLVRPKYEETIAQLLEKL